MTRSIEEKVQWLLDRAAISDLLCSFARTLDTKDFLAYADNFAPEGFVELPDPMQPGQTFILRKADMLDKLPRSLGRYSATHHLSANHQIEIQADIAHSCSYLQAVHVKGLAPDHWSAGGWYECDYVRCGAGWRFSRVRLTAVWIDGEPGVIRPEV